MKCPFFNCTYNDNDNEGECFKNAGGGNEPEIVMIGYGIMQCFTYHFDSKIILNDE